MKLIQKNSTANTSARNTAIKYIVIHYTAGTTSKCKSGENVASWFSKSTTKASSDFIVDDDSVTQFNGDIDNRYTWHCGGTKYKNNGGSLYKVCTNANSIGIEICSNNSAGKVKSANDSSWYFTDSAITNTRELVVYLMDKYNIPISNVVRHYDVTGKLCPGIIGWNKESGNEEKWLEFKNSLFPKVDYNYLYESYKNALKEIDELKSKLESIRSIIE